MLFNIRFYAFYCFAKYPSRVMFCGIANLIFSINSQSLNRQKLLKHYFIAVFPKTVCEKRQYGGTMTRFMKHNNELKAWLIAELQLLLEPFGIRKETIIDAVEKMLKELERDGNNVNAWLVPMVLAKIFETKGFLLINPLTPAGNAIPFNVLTAAYALWRDAQKTAVMRGVDELDAVETLIRVVHSITDRLARGDGKQIRNIQNYMFTGYRKKLRRIAAKIGVSPGIEPERASFGRRGLYRRA
jgi:hypothetical protein